MLTRDDLHPYQKRAVQFILDKKKVALFLGLGMGKTVSTLTAISDLVDGLEVSKVLIIAPLRVANTVWHKELSNWSHINHLTYSICTGSEKNRIAALEKNADIYLINADVVPWLVDYVNPKKWPFDMVIYDESSLFKNHGSKRFKAMKKTLPRCNYSVLLTGTPSPNGLLDIWSQIFLLDSGDRLGKNITAYRGRWFESDYMGYSFTPRYGAQDEIQGLMSDISLSMQAEDYLELPDKLMINKNVDLPTKCATQYKELEKEFLLALDNDLEIEAPSAAAVANKLLQICNGSIYTENGEYEILHNEKIKALRGIIDDNPNENILIAYNYKFDKDCILKEFKQARVLGKKGEEVDKWNNGEIPLLLAHPASAGHGLNLQKGGTIMVWYGMTWNLEYYQQMNGRLHRQGQDKTVRIVHLLAHSDKFETIDKRVLEALSNKSMIQDNLLRSLV
jgi:SNF2 family DNA or RNA helicase